METKLLETLKEKIEPAHAALVVVDVQNDFCAPGGFFDKMGDPLQPIHAMIPRLKGLIEEARGRGVLTIFIQAIYDREFISPAFMAHRKNKGRADTSLCLTGSWGADFYEVKPMPGDIIVKKHRYSAFIGTDLDLILRSRGIRTLLMTGVATNVCVESTSRDGFMLDYNIVFVEDCTATPDEGSHEATLDNIRRYFGVVVGCKEIMDIWGESQEKIKLEV